MRGVAASGRRRIAHRELVQRGVPVEVRPVTLRAADVFEPLHEPAQPRAVGVGLVVNVGERVRGVAVAPVGVERCLGEIGCVVETELLGPAVREEPEIPRRFAMHRCELLDIGPSIGQRVAGARERDRRREGEQGERVVGHPLEMFHECRGPRAVATFTPDPDRLDVAAIVVARRRQRGRGARSREMAGHRGRAAGAVGPLGSDQRKPGVSRA